PLVAQGEGWRVERVGDAAGGLPTGVMYTSSAGETPMALDVRNRSGAPGRGRTRLGIIDCDVHQGTRGVADLFPYLSSHWVNYIQESGFGGLPNAPYPKGANGGSRADSRPPGGGPPGSDPDFLREQLLDTFGIDRAV